MNKPPAFQFYPDDFLGGTVHFTDAEVGLYMRLLCVQWSVGSLPDDDSELSSYGKAQPSTPIGRVKAKFQKCDDDRLRNPRLEAERSKQAEFRRERSQSGTKGASKRWLSHSSAIKEPLAKDGSPSPSPSPSPNAYRERDFPEVNGRPTLDEVRAVAQKVGLAEWKADDWYDEMDGCGWLDYNHRSIVNWQSTLTRICRKWESDGRPDSPPKPKNNSSSQKQETLLDKQIKAFEKL